MAGAIGALLLSLGLLVLEVGWWTLPILVAVLALCTRTALLVQAGGQSIAAIKRGQGEIQREQRELLRGQREIKREQRELRGRKCHHKLPASMTMDAADVQRLAETVSAALAAHRPAPSSSVAGPVRPLEALGGSSQAEFTLSLPVSSSSVELWLQVADFDVLTNEFQVRILVDKAQVSEGRLGAHTAGSLIALGAVEVQGSQELTVEVCHSPGAQSPLPADGAFSQAVAVVSHPVLPGATLVVRPTAPREVVNA